MINMPPAAAPSRWEGRLFRAAEFGHYSVDVFIVLSGYCLMLPILRGQQTTVATFLKRRAWRILPPYYLATAISLLLIATVIGQPSGTHWDVCLPVTLQSIAWHAILIHDWTRAAPTINHALWSIGVEWKIYFLFPALVMLRARWGIARTAVLATVLGYGAWLVCLRLGVLNPSPWGSSFYYVGLFSLGMFAAEVAEQLAQAPLSASRQRLLLTTMTVVVGALSLSRLRPLVDDQVRSLFVGTWSVALFTTLHTGAAPGWLRRIVESRPVLAVGRIGYSLYLIHAPILQLVFLYVVKPMGDTPLRAPMMVAASLIASLAAAQLFYLIAERPFHKRSRLVRDEVRVVTGVALS